MKVYPSSELLIARRRIDELPNVKLLQDWSWDQDKERWYIHVRLMIKTHGSKFVPPETDWYVSVESIYPWGKIEFFPAKENGLKYIFQHQMNHGEIDDKPWLYDNICLETSVAAIARCGHDSGEPFDADERLFWYFERSLSWLEAAATETLSLDGDPFEIPHYPKYDLSCFAFLENQRTFHIWKNCETNFGWVEYTRFNPQHNVYIATRFLKKNKHPVYGVAWGMAIKERAEQSVQRAIWVRLPDVPVIPPWQAPKTWGDLKTVCTLQGIDLFGYIQGMADDIRDGKVHLLVIGFPIAGRVGETPNRLHWLAIKLPILSYRKNSKGFSKSNWWQLDCRVNFNDYSNIQWINSENWDLVDISSRGSFDTIVATMKTLIIGGGAIGAILGEQLIRAGLRNVCYIDDDRIKAGNLLRHTLDLMDIGQPKAATLAKRGNSLFPHANITFINNEFPPLKEQDVAIINDANVIIDCSASDDVLINLSRFPWQNKKTFISVSTNIGASKLFFFTVRDRQFPSKLYLEMLQPWLNDDLDLYAEFDLPREGVGCWHPVYPARIDDIEMMISLAVKQIEVAVRNPSFKAVFKIFEQQKSDNVVCGIQLIHQEERDGG
jgi:hypothetical protein